MGQYQLCLLYQWVYHYPKTKYAREDEDVRAPGRSRILLFLYCIYQPDIRTCQYHQNGTRHITDQSNPSSRPCPSVAQLPRTLHGLDVSRPARPSCSLMSSGLSAPSTSCLLQNTRSGTPLSSSSESMVNNSLRDVVSRA
jgi:hypothetical protein